jgi:hypothetical protein
LKLAENLPTLVNHTRKPTIVVAKDHVIICGQFVVRPTSITPSQWLHFWERVQ